MLDEILESILQQKQRALLTGLGIFWGVFILIILVGLGSGLEKGVLSLFNVFSNNAVWITFNKTAEDHKGLAAGRIIRLTKNDLQKIKSNVSQIQFLSPEATLGRGSLVFYNDNSGWFDIKGVNQEYFKIKKLSPSNGRVLNQLDLHLNRKVVLIGKSVAEALFKDEDHAVGRLIKIDTEFYTVIGVIKSDLSTFTESRNMYIPYSTFEMNYALYDQISTLAVSIKKKISNNKLIEKRIRSVLSQTLHFNEADKTVLYFMSLKVQMEAFELLFSTINAFLWFIGLSTLLSGIISIGNMMFMIVKERSKEIGLRKALGAKPSRLRKHFIGEAIIMTSLAGFVGMFLGMFVLYAIENSLNSEGGLISEFQIDMTIGFMATLLIILAGTLAGFLPAHAAARIDPIEALRQE